jgi:O-antigen ligase
MLCGLLTGVVALILAVCLLGDIEFGNIAAFKDVVNGSGALEIFLSCALSCFIASTLFKYCPVDFFLENIGHRDLWLVGLGLMASVHFLSGTHSSPENLALILPVGIVLAKGTMGWVSWQENYFHRQRKIYFVFALFLVTLVVGAVHRSPVGSIYQYHGQLRWSGIWDNPNTFGLLMGTGIMLALGTLINNYTKIQNEAVVMDPPDKNKGRASGICVFLAIGFLALATGCMGINLLKSYSRGAWLSTLCGLGYLTVQVFKCQGSDSSKVGTLCYLRLLWLKKDWLLLPAILVSVFVLVFWHFQQTDWHPVQRVLSAVNAVDFSWRNRVDAWEGDLQIIAEHPWLGTGWNQPERLYQHYYLPSQLTESTAIEMNDYLMLGATLGIPALFCFAMYLWLSLTRKTESEVCLIRPAATFRPSNVVKGNFDWLQATCRAGAIVLLIGFWFDGGLFKLPTASAFWILLELGNVSNHEFTRIIAND